MVLEHEIQMGYLDGAESALRSGLPWPDLDRVLEQLYEHSNAHFLAENHLMRLQAYPEYGAHSGEHDDMVGLIEELRKAAVARETGAALAVLGRFRGTLVAHIQDMDRRLASFVAEHGIPIVRRPDALARPEG